LNLVAYLPDHQPLAMAMAQLMVKCIELEIYRKENEKNDFFRDRSLELTLDHLERGVIVLNDKNHIRRINLKALDYLGMESKSLLKRTFQDLTALAEWRNLEKPFWLSRDDGTLFRLRREPLVHQGRMIGSLILIDPEWDTSKKPVRSKIALTEKPLGKSPAFLKALEVAENASRFDSCVLITGTTGTGKEVMARHIHASSARCHKSFLAVNCGAIPKELLGSELFGYAEGAFTGAKKKGRAGKFELANGSTLLLDEIAEMPMESQVYLLRVIEDMSLTRLGGTKQIPVDVRIIATTNKDLHSMVKEGLFRPDLFYRLNVLHVALPPLKERKEDIPLLADHFREVLSEALSKTVTDISQNALEALMAYEWPGNIRELRNAMEKAMVTCLGKTIVWEDLPEEIRIGGPIPAQLSVKERERYLHFLRAYRESEGNITKVAKMLNVSRPTVYAWRKKLGLD